MENLSLAEMIGWIAKWFVVIMLSLGLVYIVTIMAAPVVKAVGENISFLVLRNPQDINSLAKWILVSLGVFGFAKLLRQNK